jgi:hypothetical protein
MEDGPEEADGSYERRGKVYRLAEDDSWVWKVFDGDTYLAIVTQLEPTTEGHKYSAKCDGEEEPEVPATDDWRAAVDHLIDTSNL